MQISRRKSRTIELERDNIFSTTGRYNDELTRIRFNYVAESGTDLIDIQSTGKRRSGDDK